MKSIFERSTNYIFQWVEWEFQKETYHSEKQAVAVAGVQK